MAAAVLKAQTEQQTRAAVAVQAVEAAATVVQELSL
jgi:hypothetical protein